MAKFKCVNCDELKSRAEFGLCEECLNELKIMQEEFEKKWRLK